MPEANSPEEERLAEANAHQRLWRKWGPYLSERQWGTVREDYSADGDAWNYFPHEHARAALIAGARTASVASAMPTSVFASPSRCGTAGIRY